MEIFEELMQMDFEKYIILPNEFVWGCIVNFYINRNEKKNEKNRKIIKFFPSVIFCNFPLWTIW
jgi:hypothetical protein